MFFIMSNGKVFHILDVEDGHAPAPCGAKLDKYSRWMLQQGKPSRNVFEQIPTAGRLCKKCETAESSGA
jgi:hypothetical protein